MRFEITAAELLADTDMLHILLNKLRDTVRWDPDDIPHSKYLQFLDDGVPIHHAVLFSPVLSQTVLDTYVPVSWPGQPTDEDGELTRLTYGEYLRVTEVTGGYCLQFAGGPKTARNNITLPSNSQLRTQVAMAGGFLTKAEVDAIKIVESP